MKQGQSLHPLTSTLIPSISTYLIFSLFYLPVSYTTSTYLTVDKVSLFSFIGVYDTSDSPSLSSTERTYIVFEVFEHDSVYRRKYKNVATLPLCVLIDV